VVRARENKQAFWVEAGESQPQPVEDIAGDL
jgi:hypothetical protein